MRTEDRLASDQIWKWRRVEGVSRRQRKIVLGDLHYVPSLHEPEDEENGRYVPDWPATSQADLRLVQ